MTNHQITLIQQSWEIVKPAARQAGLSFYDKLFSAAPGIRHLFKKDINDQAGKLVAMLGFVVSKLGRLEDIIEDVQKLGARHNGYGARPEHYDVVEYCLVAVLKEELNEQWTDDLEQAWLTAFDILKTTMVAAQQAKNSTYSTAFAAMG